MERDEGRVLTDEYLIELEKEIRRIYAEAGVELMETIDAHFDKLVAKDRAMKQQLDAGKITTEQYKQWRLAYIGRGKRFEELRDKLAERVTHANEVARAYVNDKTPTIYTLNRNFAAYRVEKSTGFRYKSFTLLDEDTIRRLIMQQPDLMPNYPTARAVKRGIDLEYGRKQITAAVTSGILQGKSTRKIAADLRERLVDMSVESAIRTARTAVTAAENGGRADTFDLAEKLGIKVKKRWMSTLDARTRPAHRHADGQVRRVGETFDVGGEALMFPGDKKHGASGWNLYNCRCGLDSADDEEFEKEPKFRRAKNLLTGKDEIIPYMSFDEWWGLKRGQNPERWDIAEKMQKNLNGDKALLEKYKLEFGENAPKSLDELQSMKYIQPDRWELYKQYVRELREDKLSPFASFELFAGVKAKCDGIFVGTKTSNGIEIKGTSVHFVSRIIGSEREKRDGINFQDVEEALWEGKPRAEKIGEQGRKSIVLVGSKAQASVNPQTGILVQCNPI